MKSITKKAEVSLRSYYDLLIYKPTTAAETSAKREFMQQYMELVASYRDTIKSDFERESFNTILREKLENAELPKTRWSSVDVPANIVLKTLPNILEETLNEVKALGLTDITQETLTGGTAGTKGWTYRTWHNVLRYLLRRAQAQVEQAENNFFAAAETNKNKTKLELAIKKQYYASIVRMLMNMKKLIKDRKIKSPDDVIMDSWLLGVGIGAGDEFYEADANSPQRYTARGRGYPREGGGGRGGFGEEEGFTSADYRMALNFPFSSQDGNYLYVHRLLKAFRLDGDPRYQILMESNPALPRRVWQSKNTNAAIDSIGGSLEFFSKYVPALNKAISEVLSIYIDSGRTDPKQIDEGRRYEATTRYFMNKLGLKELPTEEETEYRRPTGETASPRKPTGTTRDAKAEWLRWMGEDNFKEKTHDELEKAGYEWNGEGWFINNKLGRYVNNNTGRIYERIPGTRVPKYKNIGHMMDSNYMDLLLGR